MINVKELRIGNKVLLRHKVVEVESIIDFGINVEGGDGGKYYEEHLEPIPLTPEILEAAGFKTYGSRTSLFSDSLGLGTIEAVGKECYLDFEGTKCGVGIKYLHQLQNLYFALTGEELEIAR